MWLRLKQLTWNQYLGAAVIGVGVWWHSEPLVIAGLGAAAAPVRVQREE